MILMINILIGICFLFIVYENYTLKKQTEELKEISEFLTKFTKHKFLISDGDLKPNEKNDIDRKKLKFLKIKIVEE